ncbi:MAG: hypothetical protein IH891_01600 [Planctomycetes bacterium]|nr:hypothetical protein [Planctomycetota bacterium]
MMSNRVITGLLVWWMLISRPVGVRGEIPPLSEGQITRLATAQDGRDHQEEAFSALLENMKLYSGEVGDSLIRLKPDLDSMIKRPTDYRGDLYLLSGVFQQQTRLSVPYESVSEWFLRNDAGVPMLIYVTGLPLESGVDFVVGDRVQMVARFYKRVDFIARDGIQRSYAAFVGAKPKKLGLIAGDPLSGMWIVVIPVFFLALVFIILFAYVRHLKKRPHRHSAPLTMKTIVDEAGTLSDDPAQALSELRQQADDQAPLPSHDASE